MARTGARNAARSRRLSPLLGAAILFLLVLLGTASAKSYHDLASARERRELLETRLQESERRIELLKSRIRRLRGDPLTLERLAREDLGMVRPGEVVIVLPREAPRSVGEQR